MNDDDNEEDDDEEEEETQSVGLEWGEWVSKKTIMSRIEQRMRRQSRAVSKSVSIPSVRP